MFKLMNFFVLFKYSLILNMMPAKHSKIAGTVETKDWESLGKLGKMY